MADVLNEDDPARDGNLSAEEYEATYAEGEPCHDYPPGLIEGLMEQLGGSDA